MTTPTSGPYAYQPQPEPREPDGYTPAPYQQQWTPQQPESPYQAPSAYQQATPEPAAPYQAPAQPPYSPQVQYQPYPPAQAQPYPSGQVQPYQDPVPYAAAPYRPYAAATPVVDPGRNLGIAGLITGLAAWWIPYVGFAAPFVAIGLGIAGLTQSKRAGYRNNIAIASIAVGAVEILLGLLMIIGLVAFVAIAAR